MSDTTYANRMDRSIEFSVARNQDFDARVQLVGADLIESVQQAVGPEVQVRDLPAHVGRGASGFGAALQVLADVESVATALIFGAKAARSAYRALRRRLGYRPNVSLGAATHLAAADLIDRLGAESFSLLGAGDTNESPMDSSFTGEDTFWVIFVAFPILYVYIVAANVRVHYMGSHEILAGTVSRLQAMPGRNGKYARQDAEDDEGDSYDDLKMP